MAALDDVRGQVGVEQDETFAARLVTAGIDQALGAGGAQLGGERLALAIVVIPKRPGTGDLVPQIVKRRIGVEHQLAELRGPARRLGGARHEARVAVDRLEQRGLEPVPDGEDAVCPALKRLGRSGVVRVNGAIR